MKKDALINRWWYGIFYITCHINPRSILALGRWANMGLSGWYDMWYEKCHIIIYKYHILMEFLRVLKPFFIVPSVFSNVYLYLKVACKKINTGNISIYIDWLTLTSIKSSVLGSSLFNCYYFLGFHFRGIKHCSLYP